MKAEDECGDGGTGKDDDPGDHARGEGVVGAAQQQEVNKDDEPAPPPATAEKVNPGGQQAAKENEEHDGCSHPHQPRAGGVIGDDGEVFGPHQLPDDEEDTVANPGDALYQRDYAGRHQRGGQAKLGKCPTVLLLGVSVCRLRCAHCVFLLTAHIPKSYRAVYRARTPLAYW